MTAHAPFRSAHGKTLCLAWYDRQLAALPVAHEARDVETSVAGRARVVLAGPAQGPPLVLVHGAGASAATLRDEIAFYTHAGHRVIAPDLPLHLGRSDARVLPLDDASYGRWLDEILTALGLDRVALIGYSFGGFVVLKLAAHAPQRIVRAAILVPAGLSPPTVWRARAIVGARILYALTKSDAWRDRMLAPMFAPGTTPRPFGVEAGRLTVEHWVPDLRRFPLFRAEQLARVTAPMLVLAGEHDPLFDCDATLAAARRVIPGVVAERLDGCGHMFDVEHADAIRARTLAFLHDAAAVTPATGSAGR